MELGQEGYQSGVLAGMGLCLLRMEVLILVPETVLLVAELFMMRLGFQVRVGLE